MAMHRPNSVFAAVLSCLLVSCASQRLFISEYVEGTGASSAVIELFNPGCADVALSEFRLVLSRNGEDWDMGLNRIVDLTPAGTIQANSTAVICQAQATSAACIASDFTALDFDGNDAVALVHNWVVIDVIGYERHFGAVSSFSVAGVAEATRDHTLIRKQSVLEGSSIWPANANNSLSSQWIVQSAGNISNLGTHSSAVVCPSTLYKLTCGTLGSSSFLSAATYPLQIECPNDCHTKHGLVFGQPAEHYSPDSPVCKAAVHAGLYTLTGRVPALDPTLGNIPHTTEGVQISRKSYSVFGHSSAADVVLLLDSSNVVASEANTTNAFVFEFLRSFDIQLRADRVRLGLVRVATTTAVLSTLSSSKDALVSSLGFVDHSESNRNTHAGLATARTSVLQATSNRLWARPFAPKWVIVTAAGPMTDSDSGQRAALLALGVNIIVVHVSTAAAPTTFAQRIALQQLATSKEHYFETTFTAWNSTIALIQDVMWNNQKCYHGRLQIPQRPLLHFNRTTATSSFNGTDTTCVTSLSKQTAQTGNFNISVISSIACLNSCSGKGTCNPRTGVCSCVHPYFGVDCSSKLCAYTCHNGGTCDYSTGMCVCTPANTYYGDDCLSKTCVAFNHCTNATRGFCDSTTGLCTCYPPYRGSDCSLVSCIDNCNGQGVCNTTEGTCACFDGYFGQFCQLKRCPDDCNQHGVCNYNTGICDCQDGVIGSDGACKHGACPNDCSGHGSCDTIHRICTCDAAWRGVDCSLPV